jgi:hypothetical protein
MYLQKFHQKNILVKKKVLTNTIKRGLSMYKSKFKESSLSRLYAHWKEHECGTISAFRYAPECGDGTPYTKQENKSRNAKLKAKLLSLGYGVTPINGVYIENYGTDKARPVREESFFVVDLKDSKNLKKDLIKLGQLYEQDSITWSEPSGSYYLISSNTCPNAFPGNGKVGVKLKLGKAMFGENGEFHSTIRNRPFVFKEGVNRVSSLTDYPPTEIRSIKELANLVS